MCPPDPCPRKTSSHPVPAHRQCPRLSEGSPLGTGPAHPGSQPVKQEGLQAVSIRGRSLHLLGEVLRVLADGLGQLGHRVQHEVIEDHL